MPGIDRHARVGASLLDRLLDAHPDQARDRVQGAAETVARLRASVHRDVEHLLNARRPWRSVAWPALRTSPLAYGISDFTAEDASPLRATLALRIDALLLMEPLPEAISFDTLVDTTTADVTLRPAQDV